MDSQRGGENLIVRLTFEFGLLIIEYTEVLEANRKFLMAKQLFRSGTSIGANIRESQAAESRADFIHKCKIAAKEAEESDYWLLLCEKAPSYPSPGDLIQKLLSIRKIISKIISSSRNPNTT